MTTLSAMCSIMFVPVPTQKATLPMKVNLMMAIADFSTTWLYRSTPMDVNLDGVSDWLVRLQVGPPGLGRGRIFVRLLYWHEDEWTLREFWNTERIAALGAFREPQPGFVYLHDQADDQNRTYMGIFFHPGIGPDVYVGGLVVLRWDEWEPEEVLFIEQACVFSPWERGDDGGLYIPQSSSVPWQGCTFPNHPPEEGIPIPGARMPDSAP